MRDAEGLAPKDVQRRLSREHRIVPMLVIAALLATAAAYVVPRGFEAGHLFAIEDDPEAIAERALAERFNGDVASREIEAALAAKDSDLAKSFVDLAAERKIALAPDLVDKVNVAVAEDASTSHAAQSFAYGLVTGEPSDVAGLAGTALGDLFVFRRHPRRSARRRAAGERAGGRRTHSRSGQCRPCHHRRHLCDRRACRAGARSG